MLPVNVGSVPNISRESFGNQPHCRYMDMVPFVHRWISKGFSNGWVRVMVPVFFAKVWRTLFSKVWL